jgi:hypothetical protein
VQFLDRFGHFRADPVITAQRIAIANHQKTAGGG